MGSYKAPPTINVIVTPQVDRSRASIYMASGIIDDGSWVPTGHLGLRLVARDLVGLTPAAATLKALHHVVRTLEHVVGEQSRTAGGPGAPRGATGGLVNVPLPGLEPSTLT